MAPKKSLRPKMRDDRPYLPEHEMPVTRSVTPDAIDPKSSVRPKMRPQYMEDDAAAVERGRRAYEREMEDMPEKYAGGGMVRGCKTSQVSGKGFKGTY
jgi:hypothetical protein